MVTAFKNDREIEMSYVKVYSGICGFTTEIEASSKDRQHVTLNVKSECPDVNRIRKELVDVIFDAYEEIGPCAQPRSIYDSRIMKICGKLPHVACPVPSGVCKAIEVAAGLAIPRDAHIRVAAERTDEEEREAKP